MQQKLHTKIAAMSSEQRDKLKKSLSTKLVETGHVSQAQAPVTSEAIIKYLEGEEDALIELIEHNPQMKVIIGETFVTPVFAIVDGLVGEIPGAGGLIDGAAELGEQAGEIGAQGYALRKELEQQKAMLAAARQGVVAGPAGTGKTVTQVAAPVIAATAAPPPPPAVVAAVAGAPAAGTARSRSKPRSSGKNRKKRRKKKKRNTKKGPRRRKKQRGGRRTRRRGGRRTRGGRRIRGGSFWKTWIKPDTCNSATDCPTDYPYCHIGRRRGMINFGLLSGHIGQCVN